MSSRNWRSRIEDILSCIANIQNFTEGMSAEEFSKDSKTIRAVAFELTTMGEAARFVSKDIQEKNPEIPWGKMQDIRNVIVHENFRLDEEILWQTIQDDLPPLKSQLESILEL
jgi:uncharacterized protein with HEPN domain